MKKKKAIEWYNRLLEEGHKYWRSKTGAIFMLTDPSRIRIVYDESEDDYGILYSAIVLEKDLGSGAMYIGFETISVYEDENIQEDFYCMVSEQKFKNELDIMGSELYDIVYGAGDDSKT